MSEKDDWGKGLREAEQFRFPFGLTVKAALWVAGIMAIIMVVGLLLIPLRLGVLWFNEGARIASPQNIRVQFATGFSYWESLVEVSQQHCNHRGLIDEAETVNERTQRRTQLVAIANQYERVKRQYNAWAEDIFRGEFVGPAVLPEAAPSLVGMQGGGVFGEQQVEGCES
jgi:hypothetical protein